MINPRNIEKRESLNHVSDKPLSPLIFRPKQFL
jgi:hypothetical protein